MSIRQGDRIIAGNVSHYNVGDVFYTSRTDTNLAGAVECNGGTYNTEDYTGAGSIGELLEAGKLDYISLSAYSTAISTKGWCDKIGWDGTGNTQFRVPTLNAHIVQTNNIPVVGNGQNFILERLSGQTGPNGVSINATSANVQRVAAGGLDGPAAFSTDPTKSGLVADASDTAQLRVMIQLATGATDTALETCTGVLADVAALKYDYVVGFQAPTAQNNYTWYRKYKSGWVEQGGRTSNFTNTAASSSGSVWVNLPITMANTNYNLVGTLCSDDNNVSGYSYRMICLHGRTTTGFTFDEWNNAASSSTSCYGSWQVSGMAA